MLIVREIALMSVLLGVSALASPSALAKAKETKPTLKEGVYRVDWNRKVRDLCVDYFTNEDLTARDWQGVLGAQGVICKLSDVKSSKTRASWVGACHQPLRGTVVHTVYRVSVAANNDHSFDMLSLISGGLQATIPIRGVPVRAADGSIAKCEKEHAPFRPWQ